VVQNCWIVLVGFGNWFLVLVKPVVDSAEVLLQILQPGISQMSGSGFLKLVVDVVVLVQMPQLGI